MDNTMILDVLRGAINVLLAVVGFLLIRTLNQVDVSMKEQREEQKRLREEHGVLRTDHGAHNTRIARLEGFQEGVRAWRDKHRAEPMEG